MNFKNKWFSDELYWLIFSNEASQIKFEFLSFYQFEFDFLLNLEDINESYNCIPNLTSIKIKNPK